MPAFIVLAVSLFLGLASPAHAASVLDDLDWEEPQNPEEPVQTLPGVREKKVQPGRKPETARRANTYFGMGYERRMQTLGSAGVPPRRGGGRGKRGR